MKNENENTQNQARRFKIVVTDLQEDKTLMDVTTNSAIISTASPFDNLENKDREGYAQGAQYFNCKSKDIMYCVQNAIEGIRKLVGEHKELGFLLSLYMMSKKAESLSNEDEEEEDEDNECS